jgi:predicted transglutaminase-like cysteine proteinase
MSVRAPTSQFELIDLLQDILDLAQTGQITALTRHPKGYEEFWAPGEINKDAEHFALTCRALLKAMTGLESDLVFCRHDDGSLHLICVRQGWALDSRCAWVCKRETLPYHWIAALRFDGAWYPILNRRQQA